MSRRLERFAMAAACVCVCACAASACSGGGARSGSDAGPADAALVDANGDAADAAPAPFSLVGAESGIVFVNQLGPETVAGGGLSWIDYDMDGRPDLFFAGDAVPSVLYRNLGDGHFADVTAAAGLADLRLALGSAVADVDNDGDPDLYVLRWGSPDRLYINDGHGHFTEEGAARGLDQVEADPGQVAAFADYDGDGWLDLYVGNYSLSPLGVLPDVRSRLYHGIGGGRFAEVMDAPMRVGQPTQAALWTDLDGDGDMDLWVVNDFGMLYAPNQLYRNDGGGNFTEVGATLGLDARLFGMGAAAADVNGDGRMDLYASNFWANPLHVQQADGSFADHARADGVAAASFVDPRGAPHFDTYDPMGDARQRGLAQFEASYVDPTSGQVGLTSWGAVFFDFDHDGRLDLFVANGAEHIGAFPEGSPQMDLLLRGIGGERFQPAALGSAAWDARPGRGVAAADYDGDGDLDLAVGVVPGAAPAACFVLRNDVGAAAGHWLKLRLIGTRSNRDGIGARVTLLAGGVSQLRERSGGGSYASTGAPELHFGLGPSTLVDQLDVRWPSGLRDRYLAVPADQTLTVVEGASPAP